MATGTPSPSDPRASAPTAAGADQCVCLRDGTVVWLRAMDSHHAAEVADDEAAGIAADDEEGHTVGHVVYARVYGPRAQMTLQVDDAFWHRGLPEELLARLRDHAARRGISTFLVRVRASDLRLLALLRREGDSRESRESAYFDVEFATLSCPGRDH